MNWKIKQISAEPTVAFAVEELYYYLKKMDRSARITRIIADCYCESDTTCLYVGCDPAFSSLLPQVQDSDLDDAVYIQVKDATGIITGTNPRSVLIAVYRYLRELGCSFLRPGRDGDVVPAYAPEKKDVFVCEAASYRHRTMCIEGAVSEEHIIDMIAWLPKVAMNGYFIQHFEPDGFLRNWYNHGKNEMIAPEPMSDADLQGIHVAIREEIKKRGLILQTVGHGWTCKPFGITTQMSLQEIGTPDSIKPYAAEIDGGQRHIRSRAIYANLCYSNPEVQDKMASAVVEYCEQNPDVSYVHFWLGDGRNNHCECKNCKEMPTEYYVQILNEIDRRLTEKGISTKIVFLLYFELLYAPVKEKLNNPDRFTLMFAPISRTYSKSYEASEEEIAAVTLPEYVRNQIVLPSSVAENVAYLRAWQNVFSGDSFDFDYHMMWDHYNDPSSVVTAKRLSEDMKNLQNIGLNGMNSCQTQRAAFPTSLPLVVMADTLWNRKASFKDIAHDYFIKAFGEDGLRVWRYLNVLADLFDPVYIRGEKEIVDEVRARELAKIPNVIDDFMPIIMRNVSNRNLDATVRKSWTYLLYHAQSAPIFAQALEYRAEGLYEDAKAKYDQFILYFKRVESEIHPVFDLNTFRARMDAKFNVKAKDITF